MSSFDSHLDAQLRAVPLPEGLLERLRAVPLADDASLDEALRDVPVAGNLLKRLHSIPLASDASLDAAVRNVPVSDDFLKQLQTIPLTDDEGLDEALRSVPVPIRLNASWRRRASQRDRFMRFSRLAVAASVVIALTLSYFSTMILSLTGGHSAVEVAQPNEHATPETPAADDGSSLTTSLASQPAEEVESPVPLASSPEVGLVKIEERRMTPATTDLGKGLNLPSAADPLLLKQDVYGAATLLSNSFDELPELPKRLVAPVPRGVDWPLVPGSNRASLIRHGVHPFVSPAAHARLQTSSVPLGVDTSSYELAKRYLDDNELPPPELVRTEDFLAAMDYGFPKPTNQDLGLTIAAGPSPFGGEGLCLVQVGVQARQILNDQHSPVQLILLVDTSTSMRWGSRMETVRRALQDMIHRLSPGDRVSLISFNQAAHVLVQDVDPESTDPLVVAVNSLYAEGSTDVAGGLREASALAEQLSGKGRPPVRTILLTDGLLELDPAWAAKIEHQVAEAAGRGFPLHVIDLGQEKQGDPQLAALAHAGRGDVHRATNTDQIRWAMREILTGRSQVVARDAKLQVTFNPKTVLEYRLLGHEAKDWAGMMPGSLQTDFHEGQSATVLYEVRLAAGGPNEVATAELTWNPPNGSKPQGSSGSQKASVKIGLKDFASSLAQTAPSLQEAAMVAQMAEILRRSPFVFARMSRSSTTTALVHLFQMTGQVDSRLYQRPAFSEFVTLVQEAIKARPIRSGARKP